MTMLVWRFEMDDKFTKTVDTTIYRVYMESTSEQEGSKEGILQIEVQSLPRH